MLRVFPNNIISNNTKINWVINNARMIIIKLVVCINLTTKLKLVLLRLLVVLDLTQVDKVAILHDSVPFSLSCSVCQLTTHVLFDELLPHLLSFFLLLLSPVDVVRPHLVLQMPLSHRNFLQA